MPRLAEYVRKIFTCALVLSSCWAVRPGFAEKLTIRITQIDNALHITSSLDAKRYTYKIDAHQLMIQKLRTIYELLAPKENEIGTVENANRFLKQQFKALEGFLQPQDKSKPTPKRNQISIPEETKFLLEGVGRSLFDPIRSSIESATEIEFVITEKEMIFPLDALFYQGKPLFLLKPVTYQFNEKTGDHLTISKGWNGCIISDPASAPGKAMLQVKNYFPNSRYFDSQKICLEDIQKLGSAKFLLLSANGGSEGIELPHMAVRSWSLASLRPEIAYLNSGKLGLSSDFLKAFQQAGTHYYIAPIFEYESGDASALTVERFFRAISRGNSPSYAMYLTRKTLYDEGLLKDNDFKWLMIQSFPFRVYKLN